MTQRPIRLMCVDDNPLLVKAIEHRIVGEPGFVWAGWIEDTQSVVQRVKSAEPDVVLLDIDMAGRSVFELVAELAHTAPQVRVVMFSGYVRADYVDRAVEVGVWGYVSKNDGIDEVLNAIARVAAGEFVLSHEVIAEQSRHSAVS